MKASLLFFGFLMAASVSFGSQATICSSEGNEEMLRIQDSQWSRGVSLVRLKSLEGKQFSVGAIQDLESKLLHLVESQQQLESQILEARAEILEDDMYSPSRFADSYKFLLFNGPKMSQVVHEASSGSVQEEFIQQLTIVEVTGRNVHRLTKTFNCMVLK